MHPSGALAGSAALPTLISGFETPALGDKNFLSCEATQFAELGHGGQSKLIQDLFK